MVALSGLCLHVRCKTTKNRFEESLCGPGKEVGDSQRGLSQALDERQTKSTGALNGMLAEDAAAMLDESRLWRNHSSTHLVQNRTNIVAGQSGESEQPIRPDSAVSTLQQPKETRLQQSSTLPRSEKKLRRPSA